MDESRKEEEGMSEKIKVLWTKLKTIFRLNNNQLQFGSYAAELAFFILFSFVPLLLTIANVIVALPISQEFLIKIIQDAVPASLQHLVVSPIQDYIKTVDANAIIIGLAVSLWPVSNVFNTLQKILNTLYKTEPRKNIVITRLFSYALTFGTVVMFAVMVMLVLFGTYVVSYIEKLWHIDLTWLQQLVQQSGLIGMLSVFVVLVIMYHVIPNVDWAWRYAVPGACVATLGFMIISETYALYLSYFAKSVTSNQTIGFFIMLMIWLYINSLAVVVGGYVNVFVYDYVVKYKHKKNKEG